MLKLIEFDYVENKGLPNEWAIESCALETMNLFAGKNSTGKSRILKALHSLAMMLCGSGEVIGLSKIVEGHLFFSETKNGDIIEIIFSLAEGCVVDETLLINNAAILTRNSSGAVKIVDNRIGIENDNQQVDSISLAVYDLSFKSQFLEVFVDWATCFCYGLHDFTMSQAIPKGEIPEESNILNMLVQGNCTESGYIQAVVSDMVEVGYHVSHLGVKPSILHGLKPYIVSLYGSPECLFVRDDDSNIDLEQLEMPKGMFRTLATLIRANYLLCACAKQPSCFIVDDLGEGLDPEYATRLTRLLFDKFAASDFQLVVTTNNEYVMNAVMNAVPIEHWSLIERSPNGVRLKNRHNSQKK